MIINIINTVIKIINIALAILKRMGYDGFK